MDRATVDSLPYIDKEYDDPNVKNAVDQLIEEEMKKNVANPSFATHANISLFKNSLLLRKEYERIKNGEKMSQFDTTRYKLEQPSSKDSVSEWEKAVDNSQSQLEHQLIRIENLELLDVYGPNNWKLYNSYLDALLESRKTALLDIKDQITNINKARKYEQTEASFKLNSLENLYAEKVYNIAQLRYAISYMETMKKNTESSES
ncbi:Pre-mRNA-splicing factor SPF27-like protein [Smittium mucronatum]|uniref:Pre-mRNA-splicing factor SPF27-like protein n=1 Tax=Smittium mucronatum TaxID=133383 RepID=A0A1R0H7C2_9FUNG|nr:Pre-mRNA-splicing factor SPF27-like protein [Smittium mucronatum]